MHKLREVQSHSFVLVFVTMQEGLSPAAQAVFTEGLSSTEPRRMELCGPGGISQHLRAFGSEALSCRAHSSAQSSRDAGPVSNTSQLLQTPLQVPSLLQELPFHTSVHFQPHYVL